MLRKIYRFIDERILENSLLQLVGGGILWIAFSCFLMFGVVDSTPATNQDYMPLIRQQQEIAKNFNTVYSLDNYEITPTKDNVKVVLSNEQCKLICNFDKNLNYLNYQKSDSCIPKIGAIFVSFLFGLIVAYPPTIILFLVIPFILSLLLKLLEKICRLLL